MRNYITLLLLCSTGLLGACMDGEWPTGDLVITNGDAIGTITDIYISTDCEDKWGNVDSSGLSIAPGASSATFEVETHVYDILACFDTDTTIDTDINTCGQVFDIEVRDYGTTEVIISDGGTIVAPPANCL
ncbi:MAG: hypothetical protein IME93_02725 [Proteobacteria bacterium]|nr:hypothetical protein [Pseudomonadota bacterium]